MLLKLYELTNNYRKVAEMEDLDSETLRDTLDSISDEIENKVINIGFIIKEKKADIKAIQDAMKELAEKKQSIEKSIDSLQCYAYDSMKLTGVNKAKTPLLSIWIQNNQPSVNVTDESMIPKSFFIEQEPKLDKKQLKEELKHGEIPGAELVQTESLRIR
ncbi:siphovirus Gp157 family protein [Enterococcus dongliensis]|nr:siphovirus Gp157 family protein [Enterococcus dongliensis]MDT2675085.1 siphovirus Gp157 family protein [Enterococcus dongliensis]